jgi:hypothetical protein
MYADAASATAGAEARAALAALSEAERAGWTWLVTRESATTSEYQEAMGVPNRTAKFQLGRMVDAGLLRVVGAGRATRYAVLRG